VLRFPDAHQPNVIGEKLNPYRRKMKSSLTTKVPSPANQGGHGSSDATTQKTKIQPKRGPESTGSSTILYTTQPAGTKGSNKGAK
jgi:hypothetical protein